MFSTDTVVVWEDGRAAVDTTVTVSEANDEEELLSVVNFLNKLNML